MDMGCCNWCSFWIVTPIYTIQKLHQLSDDRITRETLSYNNPCPSSPSSTIYMFVCVCQFVCLCEFTKMGLCCDFRAYD